MEYSVAAISDTHVGDGFKSLPLSLLDLLESRKPHLILHAGDITEGWRVIHQLNDIAEVIAVRGDNDSIELPLWEKVTMNGKTVVLVHGDRPRRKELPSIRLNKILAGIGTNLRWWNGYLSDVFQSFRNHVPDCIVCGHLHFPLKKKIDHTLVINPGAVYMNGRSVQKSIAPSMAFLTIGALTIETEFVRLNLQNLLFSGAPKTLINPKAGIEVYGCAD